MIEFFAFALFIIVFFILVYKNIRLRVKLSSTTLELLSKSIDNVVLSEKLSVALSSLTTEKDDISGAFLKFVSDSRDWAYQYIDEVQEGLNKFITDVGPEINYFKEYGAVGAMAPNYYSMKKITESYEELKKLLPEDYGKIV